MLTFPVNTEVLSPFSSTTISLSYSPILIIRIRLQSFIKVINFILIVISHKTSVQYLKKTLKKTPLLWLPIIFSQIWMKRQHTEKWQSSLPSFEKSSCWNWFQSGCVLHKIKSGVHETMGSFHVQFDQISKECGIHSTVQNVLSWFNLQKNNWSPFTPLEYCGNPSSMGNIPQ